MHSMTRSIARSKQYSAAMRLLVDRGADLTRNSMGGSVLACATRSCRPRCSISPRRGRQRNLQRRQDPLVAAAEWSRDLVQSSSNMERSAQAVGARLHTLGIATRNRDQVMLLALQSPSESDPAVTLERRPIG